jgi:hypothetical protein
MQVVIWVLGMILLAMKSSTKGHQINEIGIQHCPKTLVNFITDHFGGRWVPAVDEKGYRWEKLLSSSFWTSFFRPF